MTIVTEKGNRVDPRFLDHRSRNCVPHGPKQRDNFRGFKGLRSLVESSRPSDTDSDRLCSRLMDLTLRFVQLRTLGHRNVRLINPTSLH